MKFTRQYLQLAFLVLMVVLVRWFSSDPQRVEMYYSNGVYPRISYVLKSCFGWVPFSVGDVLYAIAALWAIVSIVRFARRVWKKEFRRSEWNSMLVKGCGTLLWIYLLFNLLWGINYNRVGIAGQLQLSMGVYTTEQLEEIQTLLLQKVNASKAALLRQHQSTFSQQELYQKAAANYNALSTQYPFLQYKPVSVKSSFWGWLGNYAGFMGYYNPFTGEAQLNATVPRFLHPYTTCHEIAHQLGYAKENEANFAGYLAASQSADTSFQYSVYLDLFMYAHRNLYNADSAAARRIAQQLSAPVKEDIAEWRRFNQSHSSVLEPIFKWVYGKYLESNQQPSGLLTYDEVTAFVIAYYRKFGRL